VVFLIGVISIAYVIGQLQEVIGKLDEKASKA